MTARQRAQAYWLLSALYTQPPDRAAALRLASAADAQADAPGAAGELARPFRDVGDVDALLQRLAQEHTRLFGGVSEDYGPPPPYESLWREGALMGQTTQQVAAAYLQMGYQPDGRHAPLDHLVEELQFMAALCNAEHEAGLAGQHAAVPALREAQASFLTQHLGAWIEGYCRAIGAAATEPYYRCLATTTAGVVMQDAQTFR